MKRPLALVAVALSAAMALQLMLPTTVFGWGSWRTGDPSGRTKTWGQAERSAVGTVSWKAPSKELLQVAVEDSQVVVLYFGKREDSDDLLKQVDLGEMAAAELVLPLRVAKPEHMAKPAASFLPAARLAQSDLWAAYSVEKEDTFIVADKYGNEFKRTDSRELAAVAREVAAHFREVRKQLKQEVATIEKSLDAGKLEDALAGLRGVFAQGVVGYPESNAAVALHDRTLQEGRKLLENSKTDSAKLKQMATIWRDTALAAEIDQAIKVLSPTAGK